MAKFQGIEVTVCVLPYEVMHGTVFVDELPMPRRPLRYTPSSHDRELFFRNLPLQKMTESQLRDYFEGFGQLLWCSLVEPTACVPRRSPWQQFSPPRKDRLYPRSEWRAKRVSPYQAEAVAIFMWERELLPWRAPEYTGGRFH